MNDNKLIYAKDLLLTIRDDTNINGVNFKIMKDHIHNAKPVDTMEVVHGRWIPIIDEPTQVLKMPMLSGYKCSVCGRYEEEEEPYCNCGAKMDGDKE